MQIINLPISDIDQIEELSKIQRWSQDIKICLETRHHFIPQDTRRDETLKIFLRRDTRQDMKHET